MIIDLSTQQRLRVIGYLEQALDVHAQRVDDDSLQVTQLEDGQLSVAYALVESAGCAGPSRSSEVTCLIPAALLE